MDVRILHADGADFDQTGRTGHFDYFVMLRLIYYLLRLSLRNLNLREKSLQVDISNFVSWHVWK